MTGIAGFLRELTEGGELDQGCARQVLDLIFEAQVPDLQVAALLTAMRMRPPTAQEIAGFASSLRDHAKPVDVGLEGLVDTCGTGGAAVKACNVSTAAAIVAAGAGVYVAKHGNRGITSGCGSADVLEALGVKIDAPTDVVVRCIREARIGFIFAPLYHPAMRVVQPIRKALPFRTIFNILGPLANPAKVGRQVIGVAEEALLERIGRALVMLGAQRAMVVHGQGLDEITISGKTRIVEVKDGQLRWSELDPTQLGLDLVPVGQLKVGGPQDSAEAIRQIVCGKDTGPRRHMVALNAAAAIVVAGLAEQIQDGLELAQQAIRGGRAQECLDRLIEISNGRA